MSKTTTPDVKILTATLKAALGMVSRVSPKNTTLPVLSTIHMTCQDDEIALSATDLDTAITVRIPATVTKPFSTCAPAVTLTSLAGAADSEHLDFIFNETIVTLHLKAHSMKSQLKCIDGDEFPPLTVPTATKLGTIKSGYLKAALKRVSIAASVDESRPILCGVQLAVINDRPTLTAADGFRLATYRLEDAELTLPEAKSKTGIVIPLKAVSHLANMLPDGESEVTISATDNTLVFAWDNVVLRTQLIDGTFPDWPQIFPQAWKHELSFQTDDMRSAVKRAEIFARESVSKVLRFNGGEDGGTLVYSIAEETGRGETLLEGEKFPFLLGANVTFVRQGLDVIQASPVRMRVNGPGAPMLFTNGNDLFRYLVMPMHLDSKEEAEKAASVAAASEAAESNA